MEENPSLNLRHELREYLGLKYEFKGKELLEEVNKRQINFKGRWTEVKKALTAIGPRFAMPPDGYQRRPITVILPWEDDDEKDEEHLHLLKCCAMYPVELDPFVIYPQYYKDEDMLIQLAYAAVGDGFSIARYYLYRAANVYIDLDLPFFTKQEPVVWNKPCRYFELVSTEHLCNLEDERVNNPKCNLNIKGDSAKYLWEKLQSIVEMEKF